MNTEILVIEDDDLVRQGIVDILELKGWNAVAAKSCSEALVRIRGEEYMLYVLDMKLPDGNGIMLCREIRRRTAIVYTNIPHALGRVRERLARARGGPAARAPASLPARMAADARRGVSAAKSARSKHFFRFAHPGASNGQNSEVGHCSKNLVTWAYAKHP